MVISYEMLTATSKVCLQLAWGDSQFSTRHRHRQRIRFLVNAFKFYEMISL
jgi:hypothetical protein